MPWKGFPVHFSMQTDRQTYKALLKAAILGHKQQNENASQINHFIPTDTCRLGRHLCSAEADSVYYYGKQFHRQYC